MSGHRPPASAVPFGHLYIWEARTWEDMTLVADMFLDHAEEWNLPIDPMTIRAGVYRAVHQLPPDDPGTRILLVSDGYRVGIVAAIQNVFNDVTATRNGCVQAMVVCRDWRHRGYTQELLYWLGEQRRLGGFKWVVHRGDRHSSCIAGYNHFDTVPLRVLMRPTSHAGRFVNRQLYPWAIRDGRPHCAHRLGPEQLAFTEADPEHVDELLEHSLAVFGSISPLDVPDEAVFVRGLAESVRLGDLSQGILMVAVTPSGSLAASCRVSRVYNPMRDCYTIWLRRVFVSPLYRGTLLAEHFVQALGAYATPRGVGSEVMLASLSRTPEGDQLFLGLGFQQVNAALMSLQPIAA